MSKFNYGIVDLMLLGIEQDRIRKAKLDLIREEAERRKAEMGRQNEIRIRAMLNAEAKKND